MFAEHSRCEADVGVFELERLALGVSAGVVGSGMGEVGPTHPLVWGRYRHSVPGTPNWSNKSQVLMLEFQA